MDRPTGSGFELRGDRCVIRPWRLGDEADLVRAADNRKIWRNLLEGFPHPYTRRDAEEWVRLCVAQPGPTEHFAIEVDGVACGGIGLKRVEDAAFARTREVGYWLAERHWGRGIATEALGLFTEHCFDQYVLHRLEATVFAWNPASGRVLEKCGYHREATLRERLWKDGTYVDVDIYARLEVPDDGAA